MIDMCCYRTPVGDVCKMPAEWGPHQDPPPSWVLPVIAHPYEPAVLLPLPLDREAIDSAALTELVGEDGDTGGQMRHIASAIVDAVLQALGVTQ